MLDTNVYWYIGLIKAEFGTASAYAWQRSCTHLMLGISYCWSDVVLEEQAPSKLDIKVMRVNSYGGYKEGPCVGDRALKVPGLIVKYGKVGERSPPKG